MKKVIFNIISCAFSILFIIGGVGYFPQNSPVSGVVTIVLGVLLLPIKPIKQLWEMIPIHRWWVKPLIAFIIFMIGGSLSQITWSEEEKAQYAEHELELQEQSELERAQKEAEKQAEKEEKKKKKLAAELEESVEQEEEIKESASSDKSSTKKDKSSTKKDNSKTTVNVNDAERLLGEDGYKNFITAAKEIGISPSDISHFREDGEWASGKCYTFSYKGVSPQLYMLDSGYVDGINLNDYQVYKDGLEPMQITDFIANSELIPYLQIETEDVVKSALNHPDTAKFAWITSGGFSRVGEYYTVSGNVKAKNSFGVQDTLKFVTEYKVSGSNYSLIYCELGGNIVAGSYIDPFANRGTVDSKITVEAGEGSFILVDNQVGEYGKMGDNGIILYYVPAGTYKVTAINKGKAFVSLPHDDENTDVYDFPNTGDVKTITVPDGYVVQLMINTSLKFEK